MYDLIGDIHGHAAELAVLLGYWRDGPAYRHPTRKAIFLGDYIDRGPETVARREHRYADHLSPPVFDMVASAL